MGGGAGRRKSPPEGDLFRRGLSVCLRRRRKLPARLGAAHIKSTGSIADRRSAGRYDFIWRGCRPSKPPPKWVCRCHLPPCPGGVLVSLDILRVALRFAQGRAAASLPSVNLKCVGAAKAAPKTGFLRAKPLGGRFGRRRLPTSLPAHVEGKAAAQPSRAAAACRSSSMMEICCGQAASHCPQAMHSLALPPSRVSHS